MYLGIHVSSSGIQNSITNGEKYGKQYPNNANCPYEISNKTNY